MKFHVLTLFPDMVMQGLMTSITGRAVQQKKIDIDAVNIRDYTQDKHGRVDDYPYGGGAGMLMQAQPVYDACQSVMEKIPQNKKKRVIYVTPQGIPFTQAKARELAAQDELLLLCGHYEGIDERVIDAFADEEISIGDYILTGGELASLVVADSVLRLQPGVLAEEKGYQDESYWDGLLEYPQFTRPEVWEGRAVPPVLLTGDHKKIDEWRGAQSRERTRERRPDLYDAWCESHPLTELPKWKRGENMRLVKTEEQMAAAARLMLEGRRAVCAQNWTPEFCARLTEEEFLARLQQEKKDGYAHYLHCTKDVPDGMVSVSHKEGRIEHLYVTEASRGRGLGVKMLDFARKKLEEHPHPVLSVLDTNARAKALYTRMGWRLTGEVEEEFDPAALPGVVHKCAMVTMRYEG